VCEWRGADESHSHVMEAGVLTYGARRAPVRTTH